MKAPGATLYVETHGAGTGVPLVVVNGGPGFSHDFMLCTGAWDVLAERQDSLAFADEMGDAKAGQASLQEYLGMIFYSPEELVRVIEDFLAR